MTYKNICKKYGRNRIASFGQRSYKNKTQKLIRGEKVGKAEKYNFVRSKKLGMDKKNSSEEEIGNYSMNEGKLDKVFDFGVNICVE